jgi:hypothetical protein
MLAIIRKSTLGRPPLPGPRTPSGRRKPTGDQRALMVGHRLRDGGLRAGLDPRMSSWANVLAMGGEITETQLEVCLLVSRIYADWAKAHGIRPTEKAASWGRLYRAPQSDDGDELSVTHSGRPMGDQERQDARAERRMAKLQRCIDDLPVPPECQRQARETLETLCVANEPVLHAMLDDVAALLDRIAGVFGFGRRGAPDSPISVTGTHRPVRRFPPLNSELIGGMRRSLGAPDRRPPLADPAEEGANRRARRDRERFRAEKGR